MDWAVDGDRITVTLEAATTGWVGFGLSVTLPEFTGAAPAFAALWGRSEFRDSLEFAPIF